MAGTDPDILSPWISKREANQQKRKENKEVRSAAPVSNRPVDEDEYESNQEQGTEQTPETPPVVEQNEASKPEITSVVPGAPEGYEEVGIVGSGGVAGVSNVTATPIQGVTARDIAIPQVKPYITGVGAAGVSNVANAQPRDNSKMDNYPRSEQQMHEGETPSVDEPSSDIVSEKTGGSDAAVVVKTSPAAIEYDTTSHKNVFPQQQETDNNFMQSIQMIPKEERDAAIAQYLAAGGKDAYRDYMSMRRYLEDPEEAAKREAKERRNQRLISAMNMIGALGNFAQAGAHTDGRSAPVANTTEAYDKKMETERKIRNENFDRANALANQYRTMAGGIIKQGYQNAQDRAKLDQQERIAQAKLDLQAQMAANRTVKDQRDYDLKKEKLAMEKELLGHRKKLLDAQATRALRAAAKASNDPEFDKNNICLSDGINNYIIPKTKWVPENIAKAWGYMSPELQKEAFDMIIMEIADSGGDTEQAINLWSQNKAKFMAMNANVLRIVVGLLMGKPGSEDMMKFLESISIKPGSQQGGGTSGGQGDGGKKPSPTGGGGNGKKRSPTAG